MSNCIDCFKDERFKAEQFLKIKEDATKYSNATKEKVAILYAEGEGYSYEEIHNKIPSGTIEIIMPSV